MQKTTRPGGFDGKLEFGNPVQTGVSSQKKWLTAPFLL
jgi:hypothetical protein